MKRFAARPLFLLATIAIVACEGTLKPSRQNPHEYTALDAAVEACDSVSVKRILTNDAKLVNEKGWSDTTPLYLAALNNCTDVAVFLLDKGADVNAKTKEAATPLHIAAQKDNLRLVKLLLAHGADIDAQDSKHRTAADRAFLWHHPKMARFLADRGRH